MSNIVMVKRQNTSYVLCFHSFTFMTFSTSLRHNKKTSCATLLYYSLCTEAVHAHLGDKSSFLDVNNDTSRTQ